MATRSDRPLGTSACPNNHAWDASMRVCAVCRVPNPAFTVDDEAQPEEPEIQSSEGKAPGEPVDTVVEHNRSLVVSNAPAATQSPAPMIDVDANLRELSEKLASFRDEHGSNGKVIGVFGSPNSGKSFLNSRLAWIVNANRGGTTGAHGYRVIRSTQSNTATWAEFELAGPAGTKHRILVVDLPGEEFNNATQARPPEVEQHSKVLGTADGLILYISADSINDKDLFHLNVYSVGTPPQENYRRFLELAYARRPKPEEGLCDLPVFVAFSRADRIINVESKSAVRDPWQFLCEKSPKLAQMLTGKFSSFCCGFVASHVGAQTRVGIGFTPRAPGESLVALKDSIAKSLAGAPLERYFLACLENQLASKSPTIERLPPPELMRRCGLSEDEFFENAGLVADNANAFEETWDRVRGLASIYMVPLVDDDHASYGVRTMMDRLIDLMDEPAEGIHRRRKFDFASARAPAQANSIWTRARQAGAAAIARRMSGSDDGIGRLLRFLRMTSVLHLSRLRLASFAMFVLPMLGLVCLYAMSEVAERRESVRQTVRGAAGLPSSFALDADKVWDLDLARLDQIRSTLASKLLRLGLHDDHLVRPPDFSLALKVNEAGQPFHALLPVGSSNGGRLAREFLAGIDCSAGRTCREVAPDSVRITMPADPQRDGARVLNYAGALSAYLRGASSEDIRKYLDRFEKGRDGQWGKSIESAESPTKQILLPTLLQRLLLAHAALRDEVAKLKNGEGKGDADGRNSFRRYGKALDEALVDYVKQSASLASARKSRLPMSLGQELRVIGVGGNVLNAHLLATAVASAESFPDLQKDVFERFGRFGTQLDAEKVFDLEAYASQYPELLCLYHHMRRVVDRRATSGYAKACEASSPTADNPFEAERLLVDAKFWAGDRTRTSIALERYASLIRDAAERAAKGEQDPKVLASLQPLRQLPDERPWWMLLIEPRSLMLIVGVVVLAAFMSWLVVLLWCQVLAAHRLVSPYTRDLQQI